MIYKKKYMHRNREQEVSQFSNEEYAFVDLSRIVFFMSPADGIHIQKPITAQDIYKDHTLYTSYLAHLPQFANRATLLVFFTNQPKLNRYTSCVAWGKDPESLAFGTFENLTKQQADEIFLRVLAEAMSCVII